MDTPHKLEYNPQKMKWNCVVALKISFFLASPHPPPSPHQNISISGVYLHMTVFEKLNQSST